MRTAPIDPRTHGIVDYAFVATQLLAPTLLRLKGPARGLCYFFAGSQGVLNALTDHPVAVRRLIPFKDHGRLEVPFVPALVALPFLTGATRQRRARRYFFLFYLIATANFVLTDYNAHDRRTASRRRSDRGTGVAVGP